jgi:hypothetical protein
VDETLSGIVTAKVLHFGWNAAEILPHGKIPQLRKQYGMTPEAIAEKIRSVLKAD